MLFQTKIAKLWKRNAEVWDENLSRRFCCDYIVVWLLSDVIMRKYSRGEEKLRSVVNWNIYAITLGFIEKWCQYQVIIFGWNYTWLSHCSKTQKWKTKQEVCDIINKTSSPKEQNAKFLRRFCDIFCSSAVRIKFASHNYVLLRSHFLHKTA